MMELTGILALLRSASIAYWLVAAVVVALIAWKVKRWPLRLTGLAAAVILFGFVPVQAWWQGKQEAERREAFARDAWAHFRSLCEQKAGAKIHKTFSGVKTVRILKPLPPADDHALSDQFWLGDPYSNATPTSRRGLHAALKLASHTLPTSFGTQGRGYDFVEFPSSMAFVRLSYRGGATQHVEEPVEKALSRFGIAWEDISTKEDRERWVAGSRLSIVDTTDGSLVAERIGFLIEPGFGSRKSSRTPWLTGRGPKTTCPEAHDFSDRWFVLKVLNPVEAHRNGK